MTHLTRRELLAITTTAALEATSPEAGAGAGASVGDSVLVRREYVDGPWGQIHLRIAEPRRRRDNVRPALACFHYSPGSSRMYEAVLPRLATDRTVIAPDTPGYGASAPPPSQPTLPEYADALAAGLERLGHGPRGRPIDLLGHLTGSLLAVELATTRPRWVRRLVLSRSPAFDAERLKRGLDTRPPGTPPWLYVGLFIDSVTPGGFIEFFAR